MLSGCIQQQKKVFSKKLFIKTSPAKNIEPLPTKNNPQDPITVTLWIHGTQLFPRSALRSIFAKPHGLIPANQFDKHYHLRMIAETLAQTDPVNFPMEHIYLYGWSGALDFKERSRASHELYFGLQQLAKSYFQRFGQYPRFRLITHSHGGSVALGLPRHQSKENPIIIDELILLACPVQSKTSHLIKDPMFKEKIALYSSLDLIQILDPQRLYEECRGCGKIPFFSERKFPECENLIQVKMKIDGRALFHSDFMRLRFVAILPEILEKLREWYKQTMIECLNHEQTCHILRVYTKK